MLIRRGRREVPGDVAGKQRIATEDGPDVVVVTGESQLAVDTAVRELAERHQMLIQLLFYQPNCSYADVSRATGMPPGSIGPTRRRVLRALRGTLEQRGFDPRRAPALGLGLTNPV